MAAEMEEAAAVDKLEPMAKAAFLKFVKELAAPSCPVLISSGCVTKICVLAYRNLLQRPSQHRSGY